MLGLGLVGMANLVGKGKSYTDWLMTNPNPSLTTPTSPSHRPTRTTH